MDSREALARDLFRYVLEAESCGNIRDFGDRVAAREATADRIADAILASDWLKARDERAHRAGMLEAAGIAKAVRDGFLSPDYAFPQPIGSIQERFACDQVIAAIRAAAGGDNGR